MSNCTVINFVVLLICSINIVSVIDGHSHGAYSHDSSIGSGNEEWMSKIPDNALISSISIPGTHDTMAYDNDGDAVDTQSVSLYNQLRAGIRALDIRCKISGNSFAIHHGIYFLSASFGDVLEDVTSFLDSYPSEFILMRVKKEDNSDSAQTFQQIFDGYFNDRLEYFFVTSSQTEIPLVKEVRGKIVVLQNFDGIDTVYGPNWDASIFDIQDNFQLTTNWDLYDKWLSVKSQLQSSVYPSANQFYINFLSGAVGSFPYFVASGHSSPGSSAPRLATGLTTPGSSAYPDFPRVNCLGTLCTIAFEGTNILFYEYLSSNPQRYVGIVYMDFPGRSIVNAIIATNYYSFPGLQWSYKGTIANKYCLQVNEPSDPDAWGDNYLCSNFDLDLTWSYSGSVNNLRCTNVNEPSDPNAWRDNYLCINPQSSIQFSFSYATSMADLSNECVFMNEPSDAHAWNDNWLCTNYPKFGFQWSYAGSISNKHCVLMNEPSDPNNWHDNYICSDVDLGLRWTYGGSGGSINGYDCTQIYEASDPHAWHDNYLCVPQDENLVLYWSVRSGTYPNLDCVKVNEPSDPDTWNDNYLCFSHK